VAAARIGVHLRPNDVSRLEARGEIQLRLKDLNHARQLPVRGCGSESGHRLRELLRQGDALRQGQVREDRNNGRPMHDAPILRVRLLQALGNTTGVGFLRPCQRQPWGKPR
jgi:hypothetical protein